MKKNEQKSFFDYLERVTIVERKVKNSLRPPPKKNKG
jgi:hypothetical protein